MSGPDTDDNYYIKNKYILQDGTMTDIPFQNDDIMIKRYDEIMVKIGSHLFEAECLLNTFIKEMTEIYRDRILDIEIELPDNGSFILRKIYWDEDKRCVEFNIKKDDAESVICWDNFTLTIKNLIVNYIHISMLSDEIYRKLRH